MVDNDSIIIKPVEGLQNIAGLTPAKDRENRKRRQQLKRANEKSSDTEDQPNDTTGDQQLPVDLTESENEQSTSGGIDYCA